MNDNLKQKLKTLLLSGIAKTTDMRIEQATKDNMSYLEFLELLVNDEMILSILLDTFFSYNLWVSNWDIMG